MMKLQLVGFCLFKKVWKFTIFITGATENAHNNWVLIQLYKELLLQVTSKIQVSPSGSCLCYFRM